jgi:gas vesicle protein
MENTAEQDEGVGLLPLLAGLALGALVSILLAPRSGEETRELIVESARDGKDVVLEAVEDFTEQIGAVVNNARTKFANALELGRETYRQEIMQKHASM